MKNVALLLFFLTSIACSKEYPDTDPFVNKGAEITRAITPGRPEEFLEIENIPIYIFLPTAGNNQDRLNLVNGDGTWVGLLKDKAYNDKWVLNWSSEYGCYKIVPVKGAGPMCVMGEVKDQWHTPIRVIKKADYICYRWQFEKIPNVSTAIYYLKEIRPETSNIWYLKQQDDHPSGVIANQDHSYTYRCGWSIMPVEEFDLQNIDYRLEAEDKTTPIPDFIDEIIFSNSTDIQQSMNVTFNSKATVTSNFSESQGVQLQVATNYSVGIPKIIDGSISISTTTSASWSYGKSESREDSRSYTFPITVPPHSKYRATVTVAQYKASASYTAKYKGKTTGTIVTKMGKWSGIAVGLITYDIYDITGNRILQFKEPVPRTIDMNDYIE